MEIVSEVRDATRGYFAPLRSWKFVTGCILASAALTWYEQERTNPTNPDAAPPAEVQPSEEGIPALPNLESLGPGL